MFPETGLPVYGVLGDQVPACGILGSPISTPHSPGPLGLDPLEVNPANLYIILLGLLFPYTVEKESAAQQRTGLYGGLGYWRRASGHCPGPSQD